MLQRLRLQIYGLAFAALGFAACGDDSNLSEDAGPNDNRPDASFSSECIGCHGDESSPAPPKSLSGATDTGNIGVGAHRNHLDPDPTWHRPVTCNACHQVPREISDPAHMDGDGIAEITFGTLARAKGADPSWDRSSCSNVYCHGATLSSGVLTSPTWTIVDGSQDACGNCHGFPPAAPHPESTDCGQCHPTVTPGDTSFLDPDSHINGTLDVGDGAACTECHGSDGVAAPPQDLAGNTARTAKGVGAHRQHIGASDWHRQVSCSNCHVVPTSTESPGHIDGDNAAEVIFDALNPDANYNAGNATCSNLYCHSNARVANGTMVFTDDPTLDCTSCHDMIGGTLSGKHNRHFDSGLACSACHSTVGNGGFEILASGAEFHINGVRDVVFFLGGTWNPAQSRCTNLACHNNRVW